MRFITVKGQGQDRHAAMFAPADGGLHELQDNEGLTVRLDCTTCFPPAGVERGETRLLLKWG